MAIEPEPTNPLRSYRHVASLMGMPVFAVALLLMLAFVQPGSPDHMMPVWGWFFGGAILVMGLVWLFGRWAVRRQTKKGNPHCSSVEGRRYLLFVFMCSLMGVLGFAGLAVGILTTVIRLNVGMLLAAMVGALVLALAVAGVVWHAAGKPAGER